MNTNAMVLGEGQRPFSSNLARKKRRLEGNRETGETPAEETKTAKPLMLQVYESG